MLTRVLTASAAAAEKTAGQEGKYLIILMNTTGQPPLKELKNRALRQKIFEASIRRNSRGGEFDTREIASRMAKLRAERAKLLGYETIKQAQQLIGDDRAKVRSEADGLQDIYEARSGDRDFPVEIAAAEPLSRTATTRPPARSSTP